MKTFRCLTVLALAVLLSGCGTTTLLQAPRKYLYARKQTDKVSRILCLWEAAEGQGLHGDPSRGFAGQIMFFGYGDPSPVPVKGTVKIYEYDRFDSLELNPTPVHTFIFDSGGWNAHVTEGTLGYSYNVFLPYVVPHTGNANCGLRVEFIPDNGRPLSSPYTEIPLTVKHEKQAETAIRREVIHNSSTQPAEHAGSTQPAKEKKLDSLTISLPKR